MKCSATPNGPTRRAEYGRLRELGLNDGEVRLLSHRGLPMSVAPIFYTEGAGPHWPVLLDDARSLVAVGHDEGSWIAIELPSHRVVAVPREAGVPDRVVNSSLDCFALFLERVAQTRKSLVDVDDDVAVPLVDNLRRALSGLDELAFASDENWWPLILDQMREGQL